MINQQINRRSTVVLAAAAASASALTGCATATSDVKANQSRTFVLVHGAWHGSWCYQKVADRLRLAGHKVHLVTLSGLAERSNTLTPTIGLGTHVQDVVNLVQWEDLSEIVLVGHSYGGMVITGAMEALQAKVRAIVYLDAFVPESGQALADFVGRTAIENLARTNGGYLRPVPAKNFGIDPANQAWVDGKCTFQPALTFLEALPDANAYKEVRKKTYLRAARFASQAFDNIEKKLSAQPDWNVHRWDVSHDMMVDQPARTASFLIRAS